MDHTKEVLKGFNSKSCWEFRQIFRPLIARHNHEKRILFQLARCLVFRVLIHCEFNPAVYQLPAGYKLCFCVVKKEKLVATDVPSPFPDSIDLENEIAQAMSDPATRNMQAKLKSMCLLRDGHQCVVTGLYESVAIGNVDVEDVKAAYNNAMDTEMAHIMPLILWMTPIRKRISSKRLNLCGIGLSMSPALKKKKKNFKGYSGHDLNNILKAA